MVKRSVDLLQRLAAALKGYADLGNKFCSLEHVLDTVRKGGRKAQMIKSKRIWIEIEGCCCIEKSISDEFLCVAG